MISKFAPFVIAVLCAAAVYACFQLEVDTRHDRLLDQSSVEAREYRQFLDEFGSDEYIIVGLSGRPLFDVDNLDLMVEVLEELEAIPQVERVNGLPAVFRDRFGAEDPEALEEEMTTTPFYTGVFISEDRRTAGLLVQTVVLTNPRARREAVEAIQAALEPLRQAGFRVDLVGTPVFSTELNELSIGESLRMFPIAAVASFFMLLWLLRSATAIAVALVCGLCTLALTMGSIAVLGRPLNVVTTSIPLVLWVLALANLIHLIVRYQHHRQLHETPKTALQAALHEVRAACVLAAITTALGFLSLYVADIGPIQEYGFFMALGMLFSLGVNLLLGPALILWFNVGAPRKAFALYSPSFTRVGAAVTRQPWPVLVLFVLLSVGGMWGIANLKADPDSLSFLPAEHPIVGSYQYVSENLTGTKSLEVLIDTPGGWLEPEYWPILEGMAQKIEAIPEVARVMSPLEFLKIANQWNNELDPEYFALPDTREEAEELLDLFEEEDRGALEQFTAPDDGKIRLSVLIRSSKSNKMREIVAYTREQVAQLPAPLQGTVSGMAVRMDAMQDKLMQTQLFSYAVAFAAIFVTILIGLRSWGIMLLAIPPNIMPMLSIFTTMALLGISLDAATVMVASITLGIAVDDTVHFLTHYRRLRLAGDDAVPAVVHTAGAIGPSITITTLTACIGFFTLSFSVFVPIQYLGILAGIAIVIALAADLLLLPALLSVFSGKRAEAQLEAVLARE